MKVKDYIKHLQSLDQEKDIWARYEESDTRGYVTMEIPTPDVVTEEDIVTDHDGQIKLGDYIIDVW
jgi:hypothetical protein